MSNHHQCCNVNCKGTAEYTMKSSLLKWPLQSLVMMYPVQSQKCVAFRQSLGQTLIPLVNVCTSGTYHTIYLTRCMSFAISWPGLQLNRTGMAQVLAIFHALFITQYKHAATKEKALCQHLANSCVLSGAPNIKILP